MVDLEVFSLPPQIQNKTSKSQSVFLANINSEKNIQEIQFAK